MPNWKKVIVSGSDAVLNDITASGTVTMLTASSGNVITTDITVDNDIFLNDNSRIVAKNNPTQTFIELQNDDGFKLEANNTEVFSAFSNGIVFNEAGAQQADFRIESDNKCLFSNFSFSSI